MRVPSVDLRSPAARRFLGPAVAAVVVVVPLAWTALAGQGNDLHELAQSTGSAWVASPGAGTVTLIDGPSEEIVDSLPSPGAAAGDVLGIVQRGSSALVVNETRGTLARVDGATFAAGTPVLVADPGTPVTVLEGGDQAYVVDATRRTTTVLDAERLTLQATISLSSTPGPGQAAVDSEGRLWVVDSGGSGIASFRGSERVVRGPADASAQVVLVQGRAVLTDLSQGRLGLLRPDGEVAGWSCLDVRPQDTVQLLGSATSPHVYAAVAETGNVVVASLTGDCQDVVPVAGEAGHDFGPLVQSDRFVFVPDRTTGRTTIIDTADGSTTDTSELAPPGHRLQLASKDGIVFFNDLDGGTAGVLTWDGTAWRQGEALQKYDPADASPTEVAVPQEPAPAPTAPTAPPTAPEPAAPTGEPQPAPATSQPPTAVVPAPRPTATTAAAPAAGPTPAPTPRPSDAPPSPPVVVSLKATPAAVQSGVPVSFDATVAGDVTSWSWRIATSGGTELATATSAWSTSFTFPEDGDPNVVVTLTVSGPGGSSVPAQLAITVAGPPVATLTVTVTGGGTVEIDGTECSGACSVELTPGTTAGLSVPSRQFPSVFDGWGGACSGTAGCDVVVSEDTAVTAAFHQAPVEPEDCLGYDHGALAVVAEGDRWLLTDGSSRMLMLDSEEDANNALAVAQHFSTQCFIGRADAEMEYWNGPSPGAPSLSRTDCIPYDNTNLTIRSAPSGWQLVQGSMLMATFETEADAGRGLVVAQASGRQCFVGRVSPPGETQYFLP